MLDRSAVGQLSSLEQNGSDCRQAIQYIVYRLPAESCPTADLSNIVRPNGPAYSTGELVNTRLVSCNMSIFARSEDQR